jgi:hypothetical protein
MPPRLIKTGERIREAVKPLRPAATEPAAVIDFKVRKSLLRQIWTEIQADKHAPDNEAPAETEAVVIADELDPRSLVSNLSFER